MDTKISKDIEQEIRDLQKQLKGLSKNMLIKVIINLTLKLMNIEKELSENINTNTGL
jgi:hypothetical protein